MSQWSRWPGHAIGAKVPFVTTDHQLLPELASLPSHPEVVVSLYYAPFSPTLDCLGRFDSARNDSASC